jgi:hypothetical protein
MSGLIRMDANRHTFSKQNQNREVSQGNRENTGDRTRQAFNQSTLAF